MLVFFEAADSWYNPEAIHIEWSSLNIENPIKKADCPKPSFTVPQLSGVRYRTNAYPKSGLVFEHLGYPSSYFFPVTQSTKSGARHFSSSTTLAETARNYFAP